MKKISTKRPRKAKKHLLPCVTAPARRVRPKATSHTLPRAKRGSRRGQDALVRRTLLNRYQPKRRTWEQVGARYGLSRDRAYLIAHGQRPVPPALRERIRAEHSPRKLRRFIRAVAVPFLIRNWRG